MNNTRDVARVTGAFAISRLSPQLVRDVITPQILERFQLSEQRTLQLSDRVSIDLDEFNAAVATAALHGSASLNIKDGDESVRGDVSLEGDGAVVLEGPKHRWRIAHAALLSMDVSRRREALSQVLKRHTLQSGVREEILRGIEKDSLTSEELLDALHSLNASPESFAQQLAARLQRGTRVIDFLPEDSSYWGNITARCAESKTLAQFIDHELAEERAARIREDVRRGFVTVAADAIGRDERLGPIGERILEELFADPQRLVRRCKFFSAIFVIASAQLAMHTDTREKPAYWRRLVAAAHAGWVMQACRSGNVDESKFLRWVMGERGQEYMLSAFHDMREQPRWQPEWIDAEFLIPDIFGRTYAALAKLGDGAPSAWRERFESAKNRISEQAWDARTGLPSVLEGSREREMPRPEGPLAIDMQTAFDEFANAPSLEGLLGLTGWIKFFGLGAEAIPGAKLVLQQLRTKVDKAQEAEQSAATAICTRLAIVNGDHELAETIADIHVERFTSQNVSLSITQLVFQLVECGAADLEPNRGVDALANRLTSLALVLPPGDACGELLVLLENLQKIDSQLAPRLARAMHAARASMAAPKFS